MNTTQEELTRLSDVIGLIYEGATDPSRWIKDILPAVAEYIRAPQCYLFTPLHTPQNGGYMFFHGITQDQIDLYANKHQGEDVWAAAVAEKNLGFEGNVILGDELIPRERWLASKAYNECFNRDKNMAQLMTSVVFEADSTQSMVVCCSLFRGMHHPDFGEEDRARMRLVLPHLSRSLGVMHRIRLAELTIATTQAALDRLPTGVLLIDAAGEVTFANRAAQYMLASGDGLRLKKSTHAHGLGRLVAADDLPNRAIAAALRATLDRDPYATEHFSECVAVSRSSGGAAYALQFSALGNQNEFGTGSVASAIVFLTDGVQQVEVDPLLLQAAYGLSPAEMRVAIAMLECSSVNAVADYLKVSSHTVRTQLKQIYAKLGVDTRARFVKLMMGLARHCS